MKLLIIPSDGSEQFEVEVKRVYDRGSINAYGIEHKLYKAYQFDDSDRPQNYTKEYAQTKTFHGFLIGKKNISHMECYIRINYESNQQ